ncbi:MAG: hypothetical protein ACK5W9_03550 [Bdellovibrionales bacterium]
MESVNNESKKKPQKIDRVVLDLESMAAVRPLQQQVNEQLGDLAQISLKDIVNFILQERVFILTEDELNKLKSKHFDLVKALRKATFEVIKAKQNGSELQLDQVLKIIQTPGVIQNSTPKRTIKRKKKTQDSVSMDQANLAQDTQTMKE